MTRPFRIVITGGGTGGHITPALAVADILKHTTPEIVFIGSSSGMDRELITQAGYAFFGIQAGKLRRYFSWENIIDVFRVAIGCVQAWWLLMRLRPQVVFAKGGYVTVPVVYAAAFLEIPVVVHESDAVMGLANRLAWSKAAMVCTGFPVASYPQHLRSKLRFTGNPLRPMFQKSHADVLSTYRALDFAVSRPVLMILGGSQGALPINELIWQQLELLLADFQLIHIVGPNHSEKAQQRKSTLPQRLAKRYQPFGFVYEDLAAYMTVADLVVSRSSANVLAELSQLKKPTILIPLPSSASDHQRANARVFERKRAAVVLEETTLTAEKLRQTIAALMADQERRALLSRAIKQFSSPKAAEIIAETVISQIRPRS